MTFKQDFIIILTIFDVENRKMKEIYKKHSRKLRVFTKMHPNEARYD